MRDLLIALRRSVAGIKTYATVATGLFLLLGSYAGWWTLPAEFTHSLELLALCFLRCAVSRSPQLVTSQTIPNPS